MSTIKDRARQNEPKKGDGVLRQARRNAICRRFKAERARLGVTHEALAHALNHSPRYVEGYDRAKPPSLNALRWLAMAGADVNFILDGARRVARDRFGFPVDALVFGGNYGAKG